MCEDALRRLEVAGAGGVERRVDALCLQDGKQLLDERGLEKRFAARDGDAARLLPVGAVAQQAARELRGLNFLAARRIPGVGVVAVRAAQRTALQEGDGAEARPVHSAEGLDRVDASRHTLTWKVRAMTSRCCSRESL